MDPDSPVRGAPIVVFAGAGASHAVSAKEYPTTAGFRDKLPVRINAEPLYRRVVDFWKASENAGTVDIEHVLWSLTEIRRSFQDLLDPKAIPGWLLDESWLGNQATFSSTGVKSFSKLAGKLVRSVDSLVSSINTRIYDVYAKRPARENLVDNWLPLLDSLSNGPPLSLFTTNYDLVLEEAVALAHLAIDTGRTGDVWPTVEIDKWRDRNAAGLLTKLHGSVDWTRAADGTVLSGSPPGFTGDHKKHVIIYPGFKGAPEVEPFRSFHEHLDQQLGVAVGFIAIGYAFRDEHINELLERRLSHTATAVIIDPSDAITDVPIAGRAHHIKQGFDRDAVEACLQRLKPILEQAV